MALSAVGTAVRDDLFLVDLERFQGPLDLLLHLIRQQDIDVFDIPIATITDQFLRAVQHLDAEDLEGAGEFIEMAATLIRIKAQMLLPRHGEGEDEDPRAELVRRLLEYEQIREISSLLSVAEADRARLYGKGYVPPRPRPLVQETPLETTWDDVHEAALVIRLPSVRDPEHLIRTRLVAMEDKIALIMDRLGTAARIEFSKLVRPWRERMHGVMTLLAGLELSRRRAIHLRQTRPFSELWLYRRDDPGEELEPGGGTDPTRVETRPTGGAPQPTGAMSQPTGAMSGPTGDTPPPTGDTSQ